MLGTVSEWKFTELNVSCYPYQLTNFLTAKQNFDSQYFEALLLHIILSDSCLKRLTRKHANKHVHMQTKTYVANRLGKNIPYEKFFAHQRLGFS